MNRLHFSLKTLTGIKSVNYEGHRCIKRWVSPTQIEITRRKKRLSPQPEPKRSTFLDWNREAEIYAFNQRLSEKFNINKLNQAFVHKSYISEELKKQEEIGIQQPILDIEHNEELLKIGKEVISQAIKKYFTMNLPRIPEVGVMAFHDYLTSMEILSKASLHIGTKDIILTAEHPVAVETLANTFVALVGALTESVNDSHAANFVRDFLIAGLADMDLTEIWNPEQPFEALNELISKERGAPIEPRLIGQAGRNTILSAYHVGIYVDKEFLGSGFGQTIAEAKDVASINILAKIYGLLHSSQPLRFNEQMNLSN